jgi:hypothetical protein
MIVIAIINGKSEDEYLIQGQPFVDFCFKKRIIHCDLNIHTKLIVDDEDISLIKICNSEDLMIKI